MTNAKREEEEENLRNEGNLERRAANGIKDVTVGCIIEREQGWKINEYGASFETRLVEAEWKKRGWVGGRYVGGWNKNVSGKQVEVIGAGTWWTRKTWKNVEKRGNTRGRAKSERQVCHLTLAKRKWPRRRQRETSEERGDIKTLEDLAGNSHATCRKSHQGKSFSNLLIKATDYPLCLFFTFLSRYCKLLLNWQNAI